LLSRASVVLIEPMLEAKLGNYTSEVFRERIAISNRESSTAE